MLKWAGHDWGVVGGELNRVMVWGELIVISELIITVGKVDKWGVQNFGRLGHVIWVVMFGWCALVKQGRRRCGSLNVPYAWKGNCHVGCWCSYASCNKKSSIISQNIKITCYDWFTRAFVNCRNTIGVVAWLDDNRCEIDLRVDVFVLVDDFPMRQDGDTTWSWDFGLCWVVLTVGVKVLNP